jgi:regulator of PEP synthase PpsR (kinase-PPPase family)
MSDKHAPLFVVSDGTGDTAQKVVQAALRQFSGPVVPVRNFPKTNNIGQLDNLFRHAARTGAMIVTTLASRPMREAAQRLAGEYGVRYVDLLGPLLGGLQGFLNAEPEGVPGLLHRADERYFQRIEAIEFTVRCDDGKDPRMLPKADVILVGVSRTGKTPLSTFLAHKGLKVGNQPIVLDRQPPRQLFEVDRRRVFALTIDPSSLQEIRSNRVREMRAAEQVRNYCDMGYILAELEWADRLFRSNRWPVIEVTAKAIEETAATIFRLMRENGLMTATGDVSQLH